MRDGLTLVLRVEDSLAVTGLPGVLDEGPGTGGPVPQGMYGGGGPVPHGMYGI